MIPYMAAGYVADRAMGGNGMTGLAVGTGVGGFGTGAFAGALGTAGGTAATAGSTSMMSTLAAESALAGAGAGVGAGANMGASSIANPMAGASPVAQFGSVNPLTTGGFNESISPFTKAGSEFGVAGSTNLFGSPISNQTVNSALTQDKGLLNRAIEDSYVQDGFDFINKGYEGMSLMDKVGTAQMGGQVIDATNPPPPQLLQVREPQVKPSSEPTIGSPVDIVMSEPNTTFVDPRKLYEERMYG